MMSQMILDMQGKLKAKKIDQVVHQELLSNLIIRHNLPYKFVKYSELRTWINYLCLDAIMVSRNTIKVDNGRMYMKEKIMFKELLASFSSRICLTYNLWTSINIEGFIPFIAHFVDLNWKLNSNLLNFCEMPPPPTQVLSCLRKLMNFYKIGDWRKKVCSMTLDNAFANDVFQNTLRSQLLLQNGLICGGEFFYVCCCAHILNLIV